MEIPVTEQINQDTDSSYTPGLAACLLIACAYVISGKLGLMLALPPGYASPIFPPAGIAVAAVLIGGRKTLPGILFGALLLNVWIGYSPNQQISSMGLVAASIIAIASTLQAAIGGWALRKTVGYPTSLDHGAEILRFLLLSPIICLSSASISVAGLWALGVINAADLASNGAAWWIGDTLGVLVMLPLAMTVTGRPRALWKSRVRTVALPMLLIFVIVVIAYFKANQWEYADSLTDFRQHSQQAANQVQIKLEGQEILLEQIASLFGHDASGEVTRDKFQHFVQKPLMRFPMIQALEWAPAVSTENRKNFEAAQRKESPGFAIRERDTAEKLHLAGVRDSYYPVTYIEPLAGNEPAIGFDLASNPRRRNAIDKAMQTRAVVASAAVKLVQETQGQSEILLLMATHPHDNQSGIVLTVLRMNDFMDKLLRNVRPMIHTRLIDLDEPRVLYDNFSATSSPALFTQTFDFGMRHYQLETAPTPAYFKYHQGWQSWGVLSIGILGTSLLGALLLLGTGYTARVEAQVEDRTSKLKESEETALQALDDLRHQKFALDQHAIVAVTDLQGTITYANEKFTLISGYSQQELIGQNHRLLNSGQHPKQFFTDMYLTISSGNVWNGEICNRAKDGRLYWVMTTIIPYLDDEGIPMEYVSIRNDITERKKAEEALQESEQRWKFALEGAGDGVWELDLQTKELKVSRRFEDILGFAEGEFGNSGDHWQNRIHPDDKARATHTLHAYLDGESTSYFNEHKLQCKDGSYKWILARGMRVKREADGKLLRLIGTLSDISERKQLEEQIHQMAFYDALTKLPNRRLLIDRLTLGIATHKRNGGYGALMFLDLDNFKPLNDTFGHEAGDLLLIEVAKRLTASVREIDTVARLGGDEFVILLNELGTESVSSTGQATVIAKKVLAALSAPYLLALKDGSDIPVKHQCSASIGVTLFTGEDNLDEILKRADMAMYQAKAGGRSQIKFSDSNV